MVVVSIILVVLLISLVLSLGFGLGYWVACNRKLAPITVAIPKPLTRAEVRRLALSSGFKLKRQPDGTEDLNPYVYDFIDRALDLSASKDL